MKKDREGLIINIIILENLALLQVHALSTSTKYGKWWAQVGSACAYGSSSLTVWTIAGSSLRHRASSVPNCLNRVEHINKASVFTVE